MFEWIPNEGSDQSVEMRMARNSPKPAEPMGEAWFMGESRRMYMELVGDLNRLSAEQVQRPLEEIASGVSCFGPMEEWADWYHYLLPRLLPRSYEEHIDYTLELLISCFVALHPDEDCVRGPYDDFFDDVLMTLGMAMMNAERWNGRRVRIGNALHSSGVAASGYLLYNHVSGDLSASLFFCSKYLDVENFDNWLETVLRIDCPHWRAQLIVWFPAAEAVFAGKIEQPAGLGEHSSIAWGHSHVLDGHYTGRYEDENTIPFLSERCRAKKYEVLKSRLSQVDLEAWLDSVAPIEYLRKAVDSSATEFIQRFKA